MKFTPENLRAAGYVQITPGDWQKPAFLPPDGQPERVEGPPDLEGDLHAQIESDLINRRLYYVHSRTDKKTTQKKGVPDYIIAVGGDRPTTLWCEVKRKGNKLSKDQSIARHCLLALGHKHVVVYSFAEYLKAMNEL